MTLEDPTHLQLSRCISHAQSRVELWVEFVRSAQIRKMAEVGVYQGDFAAALLQGCDGVERYYMIDPWRHLDDWNKPANQDDQVFERFLQAVKEKTDFAKVRRVILRGKTTEVIDQIPDRELDFAYIDGDHTLKGITIDLVSVYPKIRVGGFLGGDDFDRSMWRHRMRFEPTLVFPFAVYFAEAVGATIYALPYDQFCLQKTDSGQFRFVDFTGQYKELELRSQLTPWKFLRLFCRDRLRALAHAVKGGS
jgi:Methyltransferase domain